MLSLSFHEEQKHWLLYRNNADRAEDEGSSHQLPCQIKLRQTTTWAVAKAPRSHVQRHSGRVPQSHTQGPGGRHRWSPPVAPGARAPASLLLPPDNIQVTLSRDPDARPPVTQSHPHDKPVTHWHHEDRALLTQLQVLADRRHQNPTHLPEADWSDCRRSTVVALNLMVRRLPLKSDV